MWERGGLGCEANGSLQNKCLHVAARTRQNDASLETVADAKEGPVRVRVGAAGALFGARERKDDAESAPTVADTETALKGKATLLAVLSKETCPGCGRAAGGVYFAKYRLERWYGGRPHQAVFTRFAVGLFAGKRKCSNKRAEWCRAGKSAVAKRGLNSPKLLNFLNLHSKFHKRCHIVVLPPGSVVLGPVVAHSEADLEAETVASTIHVRPFGNSNDTL